MFDKKIKKAQTILIQTGNRLDGKGETIASLLRNLGQSITAGNEVDTAALDIKNI